MYGDDVLRLGGILFDLLAQPGNMIVNGARNRETIVSPHVIKQLVARDRLTAALNEVIQYFEFALR